MSNASNLSTLANVLDDGSSGQFLKSTGSGGVAFDTVAAGAVVYATADLLPLSGNSAGDMGYVTATNRFYINNGSGWYSVSLVNTNPNITSVQDAGSNTTPFTLATDGTATVITVTAADPEDIPLTYGYSVTTGNASLNGSTVVQGTGSNANVFTVTPHASQEATFTITFTASDGINQATSANAFSLSFVTVVTDSNHTTLLATATGTSDNNNITDSSSNTHSITVNGDAYAGTFSPYRSGGYSTYFDGTGDNLDISASSDFDFGTGDFTFEMSFYAEANTAIQYLVTNRASGWGAGVFRFHVSAAASHIYCTFYGYDIGGYAIVPKTWNHVSAVKSGDTITLYLNGATPTPIGGWYQSHSGVNNVSMGSASKDVDVGSAGTSNYFKGYIRDLRIVKGTAITPPSGGPTERLEAVTNTSLLTCHLPYIADGSTNDHSITVNGNVSTKPFSPYDYAEYSATDHGGSVYFDGSTDYIEHQGTFTLPAGTNANWTIECWVNLDQVNLNQGILRVSSTAANGNNDDIYFSEQSGYLVTACKAGGINSGTSAFAMAANTWHHIAMVKNNGTIYLYNNGVYCGSLSDSNDYSGSYYVYGGLYYSSSYCFAGHLSDFRISNSAIYTSGTSNFTPPTAPLSSSGTLLHIKSTDASIIDKAQGSNLKLEGNTTGSTSQVKFSNTKSMYFDGSGDYIDTNKNLQGDFGTGDFTVEGWFYLNEAIGANRVLLGSGTSDSNDEFMLLLLSDGTLYYDWYDSSAWIASASTITAYTWHHIAVTRSGTQLDLWLDGTSVASNSSHSHNYNGTSTFKIGMSRVGAFFWNGYIQDVRITKGLARYTAADETSNIPSAPLEG